MSLPLPEALLLFSLHSERGTLLPTAYLWIDIGLRAAVLSELKLVGHVQARRGGQVRVNPARAQSPHHPALRDVLDVLRQECPEGTVREWFELLDKRRTDLKDPVAAVLRRRGIVKAVDRQRASLPHQPTFPTADQSAREDQILLLRASLSDEDDIQPRYGMLVALVSICRLTSSVFGDLAEVAEARAQWVFERDAILRHASGMVAEAEEV